MNRVFCIEDDPDIRELIEYTLQTAGFETRVFDCGKAFFEQNEQPDIVLLDMMLPDMDGMDILKKIRSDAETRDLPVIILTAKTGRMEKIKGLDSGADDYITKPFDILELVSRIKAVLRRSQKKEQAAELSYKEIRLSPEGHNVWVGSDEVVLTYKEFEILNMLISNIGIVITRDRLMNEVWGTDFEGETRTVDVHIRTLRQKLGFAGKYIETIRNVGYKMG